MSQPYLKWYEEDAGTPGRRVRAAWLVYDVLDSLGERQELLAYLGQHPAITPGMRDELAAVYPDISFDWDAIERAMSGAAGTDVMHLTDDEIALGLRDLARERGMSLMDLALRLGYRQRQILSEVVLLLENGSTVARLERTSGSVYGYLTEKHPEYSFLVYKARLFFAGETARLDALISAEPSGFDDAAWSARRAFWRTQLAAYCARRAG